MSTSYVTPGDEPIFKVIREYYVTKNTPPPFGLGMAQSHSLMDLAAMVRSASFEAPDLIRINDQRQSGALPDLRFLAAEGTLRGSSKRLGALAEDVQSIVEAHEKVAEQIATDLRQGKNPGLEAAENAIVATFARQIDVSNQIDDAHLAMHFRGNRAEEILRIAEEITGAPNADFQAQATTLRRHAEQLASDIGVVSETPSPAADKELESLQRAVIIAKNLDFDAVLAPPGGAEELLNAAKQNFETVMLANAATLKASTTALEVVGKSAAKSDLPGGRNLIKAFDGVSLVEPETVTHLVTQLRARAEQWKGAQKAIHEAIQTLDGFDVERLDVAVEEFAKGIRERETETHALLTELVPVAHELEAIATSLGEYEASVGRAIHERATAIDLLEGEVEKRISTGQALPPQVFDMRLYAALPTDDSRGHARRQAAELWALGGQFDNDLEAASAIRLAKSGRSLQVSPEVDAHVTHVRTVLNVNPKAERGFAPEL